MSAEVLFMWQRWVNLLMVACTAYQLVFFAVGLLLRDKPLEDGKKLRYAVMIAARNEEAVIGGLVSGLKAQQYPADRLDIYVMSDHSTDGTSTVAAAAGATVFEREDHNGSGKGYVLHALWQKIRETGRTYDGYFIFDADNRVEPDFVRQMDAAFSRGAPIVVGKRNATNFGASWIAGGYALWFLREGVVDRARNVFHSACPVTGTGFLVSNRLLEANGGWPYHLLTEDAEFTAAELLKGHRAVFCAQAMFYDEQPVTLATSWRQRMRWTKGYLQVYRRYGGRLCSGIFQKNGIACFDTAMAMLPAVLLTTLSLLLAAAGLLVGWGSGEAPLAGLTCLAKTFCGAWVTMLFFGAGTLFKEGRHIRASRRKRLFYCLTLPAFMLTYIPIAVSVLFCRVEWKPIRHMGEKAVLHEGRRIEAQNRT